MIVVCFKKDRRPPTYNKIVCNGGILKIKRESGGSYGKNSKLYEKKKLDKWSNETK